MSDIEKEFSSLKNSLEEAKKNSTPVKIGGGETLDQAVALLQNYNKKGINVYADFNGHRLYSNDITLDTAYMQVIGLTKAEDAAIREEEKQAKTWEEKEAIIKKWNSIRAEHKKEYENAKTNEEKATLIAKWNNNVKEKETGIDSIINHEPTPTLDPIPHPGPTTPSEPTTLNEYEPIQGNMTSITVNGVTFTKNEEESWTATKDGVFVGTLPANTDGSLDNKTALDFSHNFNVDTSKSLQTPEPIGKDLEIEELTFKKDVTKKPPIKRIFNTVKLELAKTVLEINMFLLLEIQNKIMNKQQNRRI